MKGSVLLEVSFDLKEFELINCRVQESSFLALVFIYHFRDGHTSGSMFLF